MEKTKKAEVIKRFANHERDTGGSEVQVALLTERIGQLTTHMSDNRHDNATKRGLQRLVVQRRRLLSYLSRENPQRYNSLIKNLGLRK